MTWTEELIAEAIEHWSDGLSAGLIALRINTKHKTGFSRNAIIGKLHRMGFSNIRGNPRLKLHKIPKKRLKKVEKDSPAPKTTKKIKTVRVTYGNAPYYAPNIKPLPAPVVVKKETQVTIDQLQHHHCREIVTKEGQPVKYCGARKKEGSSYCEKHHSINYTDRRAA